MRCVTKNCNYPPLRGFRKCASCINPKCIGCGRKIRKNQSLCYDCVIEAEERTRERGEEE